MKGNFNPKTKKKKDAYLHSANYYVNASCQRFSVADCTILDSHEHNKVAV